MKDLASVRKYVTYRYVHFSKIRFLKPFFLKTNLWFMLPFFLLIVFYTIINKNTSYQKKHQDSMLIFASLSSSSVTECFNIGTSILTI